MEIVVGIIVIYLAYLLIVNVIIPAVAFLLQASTVIFAVVSAIIAIVGAVIAIVHYFSSILTFINPYSCPEGNKNRNDTQVYSDNSKKRQENVVRRSYFFGPGYYSVTNTVKTAWKLNFASIDTAWKKARDVGKFLLRIPAYVLAFVFMVAVAIAGSIVTIFCSVVHSAIILAIMGIVYVLFTIVWIIDRVYLKLRSIKTMCPHCKHRSTVPVFVCSCGRTHTKLVPSAYGVFTHKCLCGQKLPTTFFSGRSNLNALCPRCGDSLASADSIQYNLTMVGGSSSGKTVYLAAYFHKMQEDLRVKTPINVTVPAIHQDDFEELELLYTGRARPKATELSDATKTYSLILSGGRLDSNIQFSMFDVAGEAFLSPDMQGMTFTDDMRDSDAILIILDPFSSDSMRQYAASAGDTHIGTSTVSSAVIINNFATYLRSLVNGPKTGHKISRPVAVIITKMDIPCLRKKISHQKIGQIIRTSSEAACAIDVQDAVCRDFLDLNGFGDALMALDANFEHVHYFPVSSNGGAEPGEEFEPDDFVQQPVQWLIRKTKPTLADAMGLPDSETILRGAYGF